LPARARDPGVEAVPLNAEEVPKSKAELAKIRGHLMANHPRDPQCEVCAKAKIQRRHSLYHFVKDDDPLPIDFGGPLYR
jgi:hypothetical protein